MLFLRDAGQWYGTGPKCENGIMKPPTNFQAWIRIYSQVQCTFWNRSKQLHKEVLMNESLGLTLRLSFFPCCPHLALLNNVTVLILMAVMKQVVSLCSCFTESELFVGQRNFVTSVSFFPKVLCLHYMYFYFSSMFLPFVAANH